MGPSVVPTHQSFTITDQSASQEVPWLSIVEATVLKFDRYTTDEIGMLLLCDEPFGVLQLSEHTPGFQQFAEALHTALPSSVSYAEWYLAVAFPAFDTNARCIYRRGGEPDGEPQTLPTPEQTDSGAVRRWVRILTGF